MQQLLMPVLRIIVVKIDLVILLCGNAIVLSHIDINRLCGVVVSVLASSAEGRGFDPQTKDIKIGICCFSA